MTNTDSVTSICWACAEPCPSDEGLCPRHKVSKVESDLLKSFLSQRPIEKAASGNPLLAAQCLAIWERIAREEAKFDLADKYKELRVTWQLLAVMRSWNLIPR